jgi:transposase
MYITSIGIDLGKTHLIIALDDHSKVVIKKKFSRKQLLAYTANLQPALIGIEACSGAHFIGAALRRQGHDVRLIPAQFVKPFVESNKNDFIDAEAIAEAVTGRICVLCPSRPMTSSICKPCTECAAGWCIDARQ